LVNPKVDLQFSINPASGPKKVYRYRLIQKLIISLAATGGLSGSSPRPNRIAKGLALGLPGFTLQSLAGLRLR
jgi:hypothetical protein